MPESENSLDQQLSGGVEQSSSTASASNPDAPISPSDPSTPGNGDIPPHEGITPDAGASASAVDPAPQAPSGGDVERIEPVDPPNASVEAPAESQVDPAPADAPAGSGEVDAVPENSGVENVPPDGPVTDDPAASPEAAASSYGSSAEPQAGDNVETPASDAASDATPSEASGEGEEGGSEEQGGGRRGSRFPKLPDEELKRLWDELGARKAAGQEVELEVVSINRGGVVASYSGVEVFVPVSHWALQRGQQLPPDLKAGDRFSAHVLEITNFETEARRVTATRRTQLRRDLFASLQPGQRLHGRVAEVLDFGAFVDIGGIDGLLHVSEMSYDKSARPSELLKKGDEVEVVVREVDPSRRRVSLGMKELQASPWEGADQRYPVGTNVRGTVRNVTKDGAFVRVENGVEGFVRAGELSWTRRIANPRDILKKGDEIDVVVTEVNERRQRLSLSFKRAQEDPWPSLATKFSEGSQWEGEIREISNKGVLVGIEDVEGFLPRSRMGRESRRLPDMKSGETMNVYVLEVNPETHTLIFGLVSAQEEGDGGGYSGGGYQGGEGGGGERRGGGDRDRGGFGGGERRGGGGRREGGERRGGGDRDRGGFGGGERRDRRERVEPLTPTNELKSAETVTNFSLGDLLGESIKSKLGYSDPEPEPAPAPPAPPVAEPPAAPAAEAAPAEAVPSTASEEAPSTGSASDETKSEA